MFAEYLIKVFNILFENIRFENLNIESGRERLILEKQHFSSFNGEHIFYNSLSAAVKNAAVYGNRVFLEGIHLWREYLFA